MKCNEDNSGRYPNPQEEQACAYIRRALEMLDRATSELTKIPDDKRRAEAFQRWQSTLGELSVARYVLSRNI